MNAASPLYIRVLSSYLCGQLYGNSSRPTRFLPVRLARALCTVWEVRGVEENMTKHAMTCFGSVEISTKIAINLFLYSVSCLNFYSKVKEVQCKISISCFNSVIKIH